MSPKILTDSLTDAAGDYDIGKLLGGLGVLSFIGYGGYDLIWHAAKFDAVQYGGGLGALLAAIGAMQNWKHQSELPNASQIAHPAPPQ